MVGVFVESKKLDGKIMRGRRMVGGRKELDGQNREVSQVWRYAYSRAPAPVGYNVS